MEWAFLWFVGCVMVGVIAHQKKLELLVYIPAAILFSPVVVGIIAIAVPSRVAQKVVFAEDVDANKKSHGICPECHGFVHLYAKKCKHCASDLTEHTLKLFEAADAQDRAKKTG